MKPGTLLALTILGVSPVSCGPGKPAEPAIALTTGQILTTFYPTTYLAERIAGGLVPVRCPLPDDQDPATWEPGPDAIKAYQSALLIVVNGASFEAWVPKAPLPRSRVVDSTAARPDALLHYEGTVTHSHGMSGEHSHEGIDGHTWLDPLLAVAQAEAIRDRMIDAFPDHTDAFRSNAQTLLTDLRSLDRELAELGPAMEGVTVVCSHPAYNYLGRRYGWHLVVVPLDPDAGITPQERATLAKAVADAGPNRVVLWESPPIEENARSVREAIGAESVLYSPCERDPGEGDFLGVMRDNVARLRAAVPGG